MKYLYKGIDLDRLKLGILFDSLERAEFWLNLILSNNENQNDDPIFELVEAVINAKLPLQPEITEHSCESIEQWAQKIITDFDLKGGFDVYKFAKKQLDGELCVSPNNVFYNKGPLLVVLGEKQFRIYLPSNAMTYQDRYKIAIALGYYIIYSKAGKEPCMVMNFGEEHFASVFFFANALLMPKDTFIRKYEELKGDAGSISGYYKVPEEIIKNRINELNLN
jgi:IrrE N-terminal-like domain